MEEEDALGAGEDIGSTMVAGIATRRFIIGDRRWATDDVTLDESKSVEW